MAAVTWSDISYGQPALPKLIIAQESASTVRRDSLSSSRTGDSGYISDPDISLSPLDFTAPDQIPHTSSYFTRDSSALFELKEVTSSKTKRLAINTYNPLQCKKLRTTQEIDPVPRIDVTSNPTSTQNSLDQSKPDWTGAFKRPIDTFSGTEDVEHWVQDNFHDRPQTRNLSIATLSSTGSCDMYSNTDDNSDAEDGLLITPGTLSKATLKTIELIMRKIEVNFGYAAYMQCAGNQGSRAQNSANFLRVNRGPSQASSGKRRARSDEGLPPDDPDDDDSNKRRRVSVTTTTEDSVETRFACPFFKHDPNRYRSRRTCPGPGWPTVHRMKEHLYRSHAQPIYCPRCYAMFDLDSDFSAHIRSNPCEISAPQPIEGIDRRTFESLKKRSPALRLEEDKWRDTYQLLFPEVAASDIPSPYYDSDSPTEESRRFRRELLDRIRQELLATAERESGPVEQRLLRQVAGIIRRCENDLLDSFNAPPDNQPASLPPSRRPSTTTTNIGDVPPRTHASAHYDPRTDRGPYSSIPLPPTVPVSPRTGPLVPDAAHPPPAWNPLFPVSSSDWIDWNAVFPPGPDVQSQTQSMDHEDGIPTLSAPVWTR